MNIPYIDFGGSGEEIVFLHANGYPPECYRPLLQLLAQDHHVMAMLQRPLWQNSDPEEIDDWKPLTNDLLHFLERKHTAPVIGVGHSMGGIALLRAALYEPDTFRAIVLLDPVLFPPHFIRFWQVVRSFGLGYRFHPLVSTARRRRRQFNDLERLFNGYRKKPVFKFLDDKALKAYIHGIACQVEAGGYELCYPIAWETRIYVTGLWQDMELWRGMSNLSVPMLVIYGAQSDTFWAPTARLFKRIQPHAHLAALDQASHLVPLERPAEVHALIHSFIKEIA